MEQMTLHFAFDGFRILYAGIATVMWLCSFLFSFEYLGREESGHQHASASTVPKKLYYISFFITFLSTVCVFLSADLYTLFLFFEIMSLTSYVWVAFEQDKEALRAAETYLAIAVIGGLVMLMGIFMLYGLTGTVNIAELRSYCSDLLRDVEEQRRLTGQLSGVFQGARGREFRDLFSAGICLLVGFGAKAGAFPLHIWLPKAHPVAPAPLSALLSGILTKAGIYGVLILSCNLFIAEELFSSVVLVVGIFTMLVGAVLAIFSINIKRTLACSSVSQIGFILVGIGVYGLLGEEGNLAISGALLHMVNHSLFKLVLFMAAGAIFMNVHSLDLNELRGFGRNKTLLKLIFALGSLGIMCIPLFSGYVSKTLIHEGIVEYYEGLASGEIVSHLFSAGAIRFTEILFLFSGGCTIAYMLKLFVAVFVEENTDRKRQAEFDRMEGYTRPSGEQGKAGRFGGLFSGSYMTLVSGLSLLIPALVFPIFGIFPKTFMNRIALLCTEFLHTEPLSVSYYSLTNLKGSLISILIGVVLYFGVVRTVTMRMQPDRQTESSAASGPAMNASAVSGFDAKAFFSLKNNGKEYVNCLPGWLDLEDRVYGPLLLGVLPAVFGFICRILDSLVDYLVVGLRKTLFKDSEIPHELSEGTSLTHLAGVLADKLTAFFNRTFWRRKPHEEIDHSHLFAMRREGFMENEFIILRSMSFGLIIFCLGLMATVIYLLMR